VYLLDSPNGVLGVRSINTQPQIGRHSKAAILQVLIGNLIFEFYATGIVRNSDDILGHEMRRVNFKYTLAQSIQKVALYIIPGHLQNISHQVANNKHR
jgi:hypothetical protein